MTVEELLDFIEKSMQSEKLHSCDLVHIGTKRYQTHALSARNECHELVICEYEVFEEGAKTDE